MSSEHNSNTKRNKRERDRTCVAARKMFDSLCNTS